MKRFGSWCSVKLAFHHKVGIDGAYTEDFIVFHYIQQKEGQTTTEKLKVMRPGRETNKKSTF